jgi:sialidase-1
MAILVLCLFISFISTGNIVPEKDIEKTPGKKRVLRLEPGPGNPRNSEGDFITLKSGKILFIYTHYTGGSGRDHDSAYLAVRYSENNGKTWSSESHKIIEQEGKMNIMSVSLLRLQNGEIAFFYLRKNSAEDCIPMIRFSNDEVKTWSDPHPCITDREGYFVLNNDRVIQLRNGRLIFAVALHQEPGKLRLNNIGRLFCYYSDDNGRTWKASREVQNPDSIVTQEPGLIELKNGNIMMFIRTDAGFQYISYSGDKGETWSPAERSNIRSPLSPASIERIPTTGDLLMVWNNNGGEDPVMKGKRIPLTVAISKDEGKTWEKVKNIEEDPDGWYCYTAIHFTGKDVLLGYCAGNHPDGTGLAVTQITKLSLRWIYR